jgi:LSD1 subclass zinc finger protein
MALALTVRCDSCGAPLEIPPGVHFVTCRHCSAALEVERNSEEVYTQVWDQVQKQLRLDRLDVGWENRRRQILRDSVPDDPLEMPAFWKSGRWELGLLLLAVGILSTSLFAGELSAIVPMILAVIILGTIFGIHCLKHSLYRQEFEIYRKRRFEPQQQRTCASEASK